MVSGGTRRKLSLGSSCLVSSECYSLCFTPLLGIQLFQGYQVADCSIRGRDEDEGSIHNGGGMTPRCLQHPNEWDQADQLIAWMALTERLKHLKSKLKTKMSTKNRLPIRLPPPDQHYEPQEPHLTYPDAMPNFQSSIYHDESIYGPFVTWQPLEQDLVRDGPATTTIPSGNFPLLIALAPSSPPAPMPELTKIIKEENAAATVFASCETVKISTPWPNTFNIIPLNLIPRPDEILTNDEAKSVPITISLDSPKGSPS